MPFVVIFLDDIAASEECAARKSKLARLCYRRACRFWAGLAPSVGYPRFYRFDEGFL
jgi:hypothetical protein